MVLWYQIRTAVACPLEEKIDLKFVENKFKKISNLMSKIVWNKFYLTLYHKYHTLLKPLYTIGKTANKSRFTFIWIKMYIKLITYSLLHYVIIMKSDFPIFILTFIFMSMKDKISLRKLFDWFYWNETPHRERL